MTKERFNAGLRRVMNKPVCQAFALNTAGEVVLVDPDKVVAIEPSKIDAAMRDPAMRGMVVTPIKRSPVVEMAESFERRILR